MSSKKKLTIFEILKIVFKRVRLSTLILLVITLSSTTFAWFIYATKVSTGITAHIDAWDIMFTQANTPVEEYISFNIPSIRPGMPNYTDSVTAYNRGERDAEISYEIVSVKILGTLYTTDDVLTSAQMINNLAHNYPFKITFDLTNEDIDATTGSSTFTIYAEWPFESGNDALDTYWGNKSYQYHADYPDEPSIEMTIKISAIQINN